MIVLAVLTFRLIVDSEIPSSGGKAGPELLH